MASSKNQNNREKLSDIERKLNYLVDHPDLQRRYPVKYEITWDRLLNRWCALRLKGKTYKGV